MDEDTPTSSEPVGGEGAPPRWRVDAPGSRARLSVGQDAEGEELGGKLIYIDEDGTRRRLPPRPGTLSRDELRAAAEATSYELGAAEPSYAQLAAIERLNELRASGAFSAEDYLREKRRILGLRGSGGTGTG